MMPSGIPVAPMRPCWSDHPQMRGVDRAVTDVAGDQHDRGQQRHPDEQEPEQRGDAAGGHGEAEEPHEGQQGEHRHEHARRLGAHPPCGRCRDRPERHGVVQQDEQEHGVNGHARFRVDERRQQLGRGDGAEIRADHGQRWSARPGP